MNYFLLEGKNLFFGLNFLIFKDLPLQFSANLKRIVHLNTSRKERGGESVSEKRRSHTKKTWNVILSLKSIPLTLQNLPQIIFPKGKSID